MSKAEDRYLEHFQDGRLRNCSSKEAFLLGYQQAEKDLHKSIYKAGFLDGFEDAVEGQYEKGYEQAKKDLELTWEDVRDILNLYEEVVEMDFCEDDYGEVLKRFNKERKK